MSDSFCRSIFCCFRFFSRRHINTQHLCVCPKFYSVTVLSWSTLAGRWLFIYHHFLTLSPTRPLSMLLTILHACAFACFSQHQGFVNNLPYPSWKFRAATKKIEIGRTKEHKTQRYVDEIYFAFGKNCGNSRIDRTRDNYMWTQKSSRAQWRIVWANEMRSNHHISPVF